VIESCNIPEGAKIKIGVVVAGNDEIVFLWSIVTRIICEMYVQVSTICDNSFKLRDYTSLSDVFGGKRNLKVRVVSFMFGVYQTRIILMRHFS